MNSAYNWIRFFFFSFFFFHLLKQTHTKSETKIPRNRRPFVAPWRRRKRWQRHKNRKWKCDSNSVECNGILIRGTRCVHQPCRETSTYSYELVKLKTATTFYVRWNAVILSQKWKVFATKQQQYFADECERCCNSLVLLFSRCFADETKMLPLVFRRHHRHRRGSHF